jgi:hypothetical protein
MSMQYRLPDQVVRADPWTLFCAECSQKMRIMMATPAQHGRKTRTYECVSLPKSQIRAYRWCSPPRIGYATMFPNCSIGRLQGASFPSETCVRTSL